MQFVILFFLLHTGVNAAIYPSPILPIGVVVAPGTACTQDSDCSVARAVCWPTTGNTRGDSRCACEYGHTWDHSFSRCVDPSKVNRTITTITRNHAQYAEQWLERATPHLLPSVWYCDDVSRYCWASENDVLFVSTDPRDWWHIRFSIMGLTRIPFGHMIWRCRSTRPSYLNDNGAQSSSLGTGLRAASDHCSPCTAGGNWCGTHGACNGSWVCNCTDGWYGERCEIPPTQIQNKVKAPVGGYNDAVVCNPLGSNTCGLNEVCMFKTDTPDVGVCACIAGAIRSPLSNTVSTLTSPVGGGTLVTKITQLCVNTSSIGVYVGASVDTPGPGVADVYFLKEEPTSMWWFDSDGTRHAARSDVPVDTTDPTWYPRRFTWRTFLCADKAMYHNPPITSDVFSAGVCRGMKAACGLGVASNSSRNSGVCTCSGHTITSASTGRCDRCLDGWSGLHCDQRTHACSVDRCSGAGVCLAGEIEYTERVSDTTRVTGRIVGDSNWNSPCVCNDMAVVSPAPACGTCKYLVRTPDNQLILSETQTLSTTPDSAQPSSECYCSPGYGGDTCQYAPPACSSIYCSGNNGSCVNTVTGTECKCQDAYSDTVRFFGHQCEDNTATCRERRCSGHGTCVLQNQGCECDTWWGGDDCSIHQCANDQSFDNTTKACVCNPSFYGEACQFWTCNRDSFMIDGTCDCRGQWIPDGLGNCTISRCGIHGEPYPGVPNSCNCRDYAVFGSSAPFCIPMCKGSSVRASDGNCTCAFGTSGPACEQSFSDFPLPFGTTSISTMVATAFVVGFTMLVWAFSFIEQ